MGKSILNNNQMMFNRVTIMKGKKVKIPLPQANLIAFYFFFLRGKKIRKKLVTKNYNFDNYSLMNILERVFFSF